MSGIGENETVQILIEEYSVLHDGYSFRDQLVWNQFLSLITLFTILSGLLLIVSSLEIDAPLLMVFESIFGIVGFLAMLSISTDMASNSSCKVAVRKRAEEIEKQLQTILTDPKFGQSPFSMWGKTILNREKFLEEKNRQRP